ncbi:bifunctional phosphopantothenoylcysteine decarboxylase/phosphopantothenate--cysteine ligase CoaBC [Collinsella sp. AGMB00827]|uniref:Coenzyme A biosynthesis bifunctional protein CoaBC n=1 Tax=Collinsella ureilytica TaxID=2869515 RepID=A0ABS7MKW9_9ACTN|nr:bifunctional phosphopantothenoylcysteine decarboxylase/phosphopantothenate--cysteine ligase CoaBC [Collinsella urealyticum]MBY4798009.1 bifunctional phosphopantothenoylcysteine decarboxylase/phosphopantothenate--cysteine ligase CoaBC [Collinsella urealyticum]
MRSHTDQTVLICVTGCIAAYKACEIVRDLMRRGFRVKVAMTESATQFVSPVTFRALTNEPVAVGLFADPQDPIHHISLAQEADLILVAPATANIIAKMVHGIADDLVSTTLLAARAPIVVAPAMNTAMWDAAATQANIASLKRRGVTVIEPSVGLLACGDTGRGHLAAVEDIVSKTLAVLNRSEILSGEHVLITAGGTREPIDPVRFIGNRSSGAFGFALAEACRDAAAQVSLVYAPSSRTPPSGVELIEVETAQEMYEAVESLFASATMLICAAAVADYRPSTVANHKLKKNQAPLECIELVETTDILAKMSAQKENRIVIGFAAETDHLLEHARAKLIRKGCDAIVANDVSRPDSGFGSDTTVIHWISACGSEELPLMTKRQAADEIITRASALRSKAAHNDRG